MIPADGGSLEDLVAALTTEVRRMNASLGHELARRPTRSEARFRRRLTSALLALAIVGTMWVVDQHIESCSPGARTERVVNALVRGQIDDMGDFRRVANAHQPDWCDAVAPWHSHEDHVWPTGTNLLGAAAYGVVAASLVAWVLAARRSVAREEAPDCSAGDG